MIGGIRVAGDKLFIIAFTAGLKSDFPRDHTQ